MLFTDLAERLGFSKTGMKYEVFRGQAYLHYIYKKNRSRLRVPGYNSPTSRH